MRYEVSVQVRGEDLRCGMLFQNVRHGTETVTFSYAPSYLEDGRAFSLSPDLPLGPGTFHSEGLRDLRAFGDAMPDRWGRNLLLRSERVKAQEESRAERKLFELDLLAGAGDETRQGALRIWDARGTAVAPSSTGVPKEVSLSSLLDASDLAARDLNADVQGLVAAGSSLGGARPKASVRTADGALCIAKFPKADEAPDVDAQAWERVMLILMGGSGIVVPASRLIRIKGRSVLLMRRFDRHDEERIPYISGLTAVQGNDGGSYSYLELVDFIEQEGSDPERDLPELWRRALFSCAVGNTDNHLRNYGFLWKGDGWSLAPAFDVNPTLGGGKKYLATAVDFGRPEADPRLAIEVAEYFRMDKAAAKKAARYMLGVLRSWRKVARGEGISEASANAMAPNFDRGISLLERCV